MIIIGMEKPELKIVYAHELKKTGWLPSPTKLIVGTYTYEEKLKHNENKIYTCEDIEKIKNQQRGSEIKTNYNQIELINDISEPLKQLKDKIPENTDYVLHGHAKGAELMIRLLDTMIKDKDEKYQHLKGIILWCPIQIEVVEKKSSTRIPYLFCAALAVYLAGKSAYAGIYSYTKTDVFAMSLLIACIGIQRWSHVEDKPVQPLSEVLESIKGKIKVPVLIKAEYKYGQKEAVRADMQQLDSSFSWNDLPNQLKHNVFVLDTDVDQKYHWYLTFIKSCQENLADDERSSFDKKFKSNFQNYADYFNDCMTLE